MQSKKAGVILILALISAMSVTGCTGGSSVNKEPKIVSQIEASSVKSDRESKAEETKAESQEETKEESKEEVNNVFHVGDVVDTGKATITFKSVEDYTTDNMFMQPEDGNKYIGAYFVIENTGDSDLSTGSYDFDCYADNSTADSKYFTEKALSYDSISPGRKTEGYVWFEVPQNAEKIEIEYEISWWTQDKIIFIVKE